MIATAFNSIVRGTTATEAHDSIYLVNVVSALIPSGTPLGFVAILVVRTLLFLSALYVRWFSLS